RKVAPPARLRRPRPMIGTERDVVGIARRFVDVLGGGAGQPFARVGIDARVDGGGRVLYLSSTIGHGYTSTSANGSAASLTMGKRGPRGFDSSSIAAVTSTSSFVRTRGTSTLTRVVMSCSPKRNRLVAFDCGRSAASCS